MLIYSGVRINELLNLKKEDCHIDENYIDIIKSKTESGIRKVSIADKVKKYWIHFYNKNPENQYLLTMNNRDFSGGKGDTAFRSTYWKPFTETLDMKGRHIHETRHTCATLDISCKNQQNPRSFRKNDFRKCIHPLRHSGTCQSN